MEDNWFEFLGYGATAAVLLATIQFSVGLLLGLVLGRNRNAERHEHRQVELANRVLESFCNTADRVTADLADYRRRLMDKERLLQPGEAGSHVFDKETLHQLVAEIVRANSELLDRLEQAEASIREQAQALARQAREARVDALTRLANRGAFDEELKRRLAEYQRTGSTLTLLVADVDHFKRFNDTHGHLAGDEVLKRIAASLTKATREMDFVARFGGEEFVAILPGTDLDDACIVARRVLEEVRGLHVEFNGKSLSVTASLGLAQAAPGEVAPSLIGRADTALYAAKRAGRNCAFKHDGHECLPLDASSTARDPEQQLMELCDDLRRRSKTLVTGPGD